ncbi:hypothetical protein ACR46P_004659, partial [Salmonella enterica subsp. enterica serovar Chester]
MFKDAIRKLKEDGKIVPFNRAIAEGVGYTQAKDGIHERVQIILKRELDYHPVDNPRVPEGLAVLGVRLMSPFETFIYKLSRSESSRMDRRRGVMSIANTDAYMVMSTFRIPGDSRPISRPINLPFIRRGGLMNYYGTTYHVAPVIHQPGICREHGGVFVNFDFKRKASLKFCKQPVRVLVNGKKEELFLPGTKNLFKAKNATHPDTDEKPLMYWLFGRYGFKEAIKRYTGVDVEIYPSFKIPELDLNEKVVISSGESKYNRSIMYAVVVPAEALPNVDKVGWDQNEHLLLAAIAAFFKAAHYYCSKQS